MSQHLLLDVSVIVDLWCGTNAARETEQLIDKAVANAIQIVLLHDKKENNESLKHEGSL